MKRFVYLVIAAISLVSLAVIASTWLMWQLNKPYLSPDGPRYFTVQKGERAGDILDRLHAE